MMKPEVNLDGLMNEMAWRSSDKQCPMMMAAGNPGLCMGHKCGWWNPHYGGCAIGTNYLILDHVGDRIHRVGDELMGLSNRLCDLMQKK